MVSPAKPRVRANLGVAETKHQRPDLAGQNFLLARALSKARGLPHEMATVIPIADTNLAFLSMLQGNRALASTLLSEAVGYAPEQPSARLNLALLDALAGKCTDMRMELARARRQNPAADLGSICE